MAHKLPEVHVPGLDIRPPEKKRFEYETSPMLPALHQSCMAVGARGSGKTTAVVNLLEDMPFDRIFLVSPTISSNREILSRLKIADEDMYPDTTDTKTIPKIIEQINIEAADFDRYLREMKLYKELMKKINSNTPLSMIPDSLLSMFYRDGDFRPPTHKYGGRKPCMAIVMDDILGSPMFRGKAADTINELAIRHRHVGGLAEGGALGVSLFFLVQSYKAQSGGISPMIRQNLTSMIMFKQKDKKRLAQIAEEMGGEISQHTFFRVVVDVFEDQPEHTFMFIDLFPKPNHPSRFRRNFNTFIVPPKEDYMDLVDINESDLED